MAEVFTLVIRLAVAIVTCIVLPAIREWIKQKTENEKYEQLMQIAETAVYAAEQLYHGVDPDGEIRRKYAHRIIGTAAMRLGVCFTDKEVDAMVHAAVQEINLTKYGYIPAEVEEDES
jgi:hypothetical protein